MFTLLLSLYALVLLAVAWYLYAHRRGPFLNFKQVPAGLQQAISSVSLGLLAVAILCVVAIILTNQALGLVALSLGALIMGGLGLILPRFY
ncbi:hypothetical protein [Lacticaseibacillus saniviri]|uniref:hypothetical protein n=1 Tax=Lacticaseibacillus saniviri TaxID=931533 RepID=UPI001EE06ED9|nr:hypothetical protein [Lacticaseibacillus saniviri]MCG4280840.1 hypothetical protein [Lacticaseibacillus saniviri]